ncbi:hypothetical protein ACE6H2_006686 [Prunus campanulata]
MDKSWMHADRRSEAYELGVEGFLNFALQNLGNTTEIRCPCVKCGNIRLFGVGIIREHLYFNGIDQSYKIWRWHGEPWEWTTNASRNVEEDEQSRFSYVSEELGMDDNDFANIGSDPYEFASVIGDGDEPLYPGCTDSPSWKLVDEKWPDFGNMPRNLRLALSSDGFNPHSSLSSRYSCWPVMLVTYNLPPWLCMKRKFMMLTILISGPKQPGNDIDVYLEPLIDDLKSLWDGIRGVYDAHIGEYFTLRAALLWTINDFPAYGNLSGCVVKGYKACPICGDDTPSHRLKNGHKICYIGHRKWLPINHPYRRQRAAFNGKPEYGMPPEPLTGEEVLHMVEDINYIWGSKIGGSVDVMHIEKNVCDSIIGTLLEIPGKNKDGIAARLDLLNMGVKIDLQPEYGQRRTRLPPGPWNFSRAEKRAVCNSFYGMKVPEGYSSNIKNLVSLKDSRLLGLKSHDCHTLIQQLLPVAIRSVLEKPARYRYIAEEAVEFCTDHLSDVSTVGVPSSQNMGVSKPLSGCTVGLVDMDLLNQAHLYVLENTEEVLPYIEEHMIHIKTTYSKFRKRTKWLQDKHNSTFIQWLRVKVYMLLNDIFNLLF